MSLSGEPEAKRRTLSTERNRVQVERDGSPVPSCLSMKRDHSFERRINFRGGFTGDQRVHVERAGSPGPSCLSMKSDHSMDLPVKFRGEFTGDQRVHVERAGSPGPRYLSMKSDHSMDLPVKLRGEFTGDQRVHPKRAGSPVPSCLSVKSDHSMDLPVKLRGEFTGDQRVHPKRAGSPVPSCLSVKSDHSMDLPVKLRGEFTGDQRAHQSLESWCLEQMCSKKVSSPKQSLRRTLMKLKKDELKLFQSHHNERALQALKTALKKKFECIFEGSAKQGHPALLNEIYTELYITEGGSEEVNNEHEIRQIETASKRQTTQETAILCNDIFKPLPGQEKPIRTMLTKGIAGIGKTVSVQKFILDWAEGKANQDIDFVFTLPFRDLNLKKDKAFSLMQLLQHYFPQLKEIKSIEGVEVKVLFIFDGLDECRLPLDFQSNKICCDITESSSVDVLLTNLIKGNLLPSALIWITSRPAAANQIPSECVHQVTEVRGFNDPQKEEYFKKRIRDQDQASKIISHIKSSRSLYIMCHIPVFCWISATVLETMLGKVESEGLPKTLTEMYTHFLLIQTNVKNEKYRGTNETKPKMSDREIILKLGKLAFLQLEKGNLIFYEEDLRESGIDVSEASVYSGVCTEIFKEECGLNQEKVYCFVHLSIQEYLAALFVFLSCVNENRNVLRGVESPHWACSKLLTELNSSAMDQALKSKNGHLDLFLRFLLGLSLDSVQILLGGLLTQKASRLAITYLRTRPESRSRMISETVSHIKKKISAESSPERTINLFHCLNELKDNSLVEEIQNTLRSGKLSDIKVDLGQCSALAFVLLMSEEILDEFDLKTYNINLKNYSSSAPGYWRLVPVVRNCRKAILSSCDLTEQSCEIVASALQSSNAPLRDLDLSYNNLGDSGVELLSAGLKSPNCKLQRLNLGYNNLGDSGVKLLCAGLMKPNCKLQRLDLSYNNLGDSGVELLSAGLKSPNCKLQRLDLGYNNLGDSGVKLLCAGLMNPNCKLLG
ncbi:NLR family CARD domain-containing protein 3-like isoform X1 [Anguilla rostrata]|uniref:NLR family CARD domain-containing protein 3-like isoform X1 n=1 Tax=Anguilla rostrata TaxID=7938 RepID=UPI0030CC8064